MATNECNTKAVDGGELMDSVERWLINLTGEQYLWILELFVIVLLALSLGYLVNRVIDCLLYTSPSPRDLSTSRMPSSA